MGWENKFHCEKETFCKRVLNYYWPNAISYKDIQTTDFTIWRGTIDILTGGFPCQPFSVAGKRKGKDDERHLWPEMLRAIREIQPLWVVGENVRGLISWNGGLVFDEVQTDLEAAGYEVIPFILPAAGVNAPHRRDRIWFVAHSGSNGLESRRLGENRRQKGQSKGERYKRERIRADNWGTGKQRDVTNAEGIRQEQPWHSRSRRSGSKNDSTRDVANTSSTGRKKFDIPAKSNRQRHGSGGDNARSTNWQDFPTQSPVRLRNDGISHWMVRHLNPEIYATIIKGYTNKDLQEVREAIYPSEVQWKIGGLYQIHEPRILLEIVQLCSSSNIKQNELSPFSKEASKGLLRVLRKYGSFGCTPCGRKLEKQFRTELANTLPYLSHEIALAAKAFEKEYERYETWHRNESIKALGNAIVPQVAYQIFKAIETMISKSCL